MCIPSLSILASVFRWVKRTTNRICVCLWYVFIYNFNVSFMNDYNDNEAAKLLNNDRSVESKLSIRGKRNSYRFLFGLLLTRMNTETSKNLKNNISHLTFKPSFGSEWPSTRFNFIFITLKIKILRKYFYGMFIELLAV